MIKPSFDGITCIYRPEIDIQENISMHLCLQKGIKYLTGFSMLSCLCVCVLDISSLDVSNCVYSERKTVYTLIRHKILTTDR